jgi:predicted Zn-dependent peptidase
MIAKTVTARLCRVTIQGMTLELTKLANGLPVIRVPMKGVESLTVMALANTGARFEPRGKEGLAHFFEHIVFRGTQKFPTAQKLSATVDSLGADFNAFTNHEYTGYYVKSAAKHLHTALDVVSDLLLAPLIRSEDVEREKSVIGEEINMYHDMPARHISNLFGELVYQGSSLGHSVVGTKQTVNALSPADFQAFMSQWYGLPNMVLVLSGKESVVNDQNTLRLAEDMFNKQHDQRQEAHQDINPFLADEALASERLKVEFRQTQQAHFVLGWPGIKRSHPDRYALAILSAVLGGNMSSRLFTEVREKRGLCYYVHSEADQFHDKGLLGAAAGVDPARIIEAIQVSVGVFHELAAGSKKLTKTELKRAQEYLVGKLVLNMEDSDFVAQFAGLRQILLNEVTTPQETIAKIQAVTLEQVTALAERLIQPGQLRLGLIGPYQDERTFAELIKDL